MKNKLKIRWRFSTLLLGNYLMFTLVLILIVISMIVFTLFRVGKNIEKNDLSAYDDLLRSEQYDEIPAEKILGNKGSFVVVNDNNEIIYKSNDQSKLLSLNSVEIEYIRGYASSLSIKTSRFSTSENKKQLLIEIEGKKDNGQGFTDQYILNEDETIVYSSTKSLMNVTPANEQALLAYALEGDFTLEIFQIPNEMKEQNIVLAYNSNELKDIDLDDIKKIFQNSWNIFLLLYGILLFLFILWLQRKVKRPLNILQNALGQFSRGERQGYLTYKGPKEFVEIFDSFNEMSENLYKSEIERKKAEEDKKQMLADISHDLKTPITVIQGYARAIDDGLVPKEEEGQYMEVILQNSIALDELINVFHEYSKMEHPDYQIRLEKDDITIFLRDYIAEKYNHFELAEFNLKIDVPEERIICYINKMELKRALENIISNVIKHNRAGTTMYCALKKTNDKVKITIADDGEGIPEELAEDIFKPFSVGERSRTKRGSGLGLTISQKIIQAHNGEIIFKSDESAQYKTIFEITLPIE